MDFMDKLKTLTEYSRQNLGTNRSPVSQIIRTYQTEIEAALLKGYSPYDVVRVLKTESPEEFETINQPALITALYRKKYQLLKKVNI